MSGPCISIRLASLMFLWECVLTLGWWSLVVGAGPGDSTSTTSSGSSFSGSAGPLGWLLSDKGPFHHSQEFVDFTERYQQGFTTKYKIYRSFMKDPWLCFDVQ